MEDKLEKTMFKDIEREELNSIYIKSEVFISERNSDDEEASFIRSFYSPVNSLAGCSDYLDHRRDTVEKIKELIEKEIKETYLCQRGSFYNYNGVPFDQVRVTLSNGGWSAYPHWKDGSVDYFSERRRIGSERIRELLNK